MLISGNCNPRTTEPWCRLAPGARSLRLVLVTVIAITLMLLGGLEGIAAEVLDARRMTTNAQLREAYLDILRDATSVNGRTLRLQLIVRFDTRKNLDFGTFVLPPELRVTRLDLRFIAYRGRRIQRDFHVNALRIDPTFARKLNLEVKY